MCLCVCIVCCVLNKLTETLISIAILVFATDHVTLGYIYNWLPLLLTQLQKHLNRFLLLEVDPDFHP